MYVIGKCSSVRVCGFVYVHFLFVPFFILQVNILNSYFILCAVLSGGNVASDLNSAMQNTTKKYSLRAGLACQQWYQILIYVLLVCSEPVLLTSNCLATVVLYH